jgi:hypothetical protein
MNSQVNQHVNLNASKSTQHGLRLFLGLIPVILLLLCFLMLRLVNIADFPFFVDETRHIGRARIIWSFSDIHVSTTPGKFLLYYWMGAFGIPPNAAQWLSRSSVVIFSMLGAAGTFALARLWFSWASGLLALAILSVFPFMLFYERLALSDPMAASLVMLTAWWSVVVARRPTYRRALGLGLLLSVMMMGKILAAPLLVLPVLAILLVSPYTNHLLKLPWREMPKSAFQLLKETYSSYLILMFAVFMMIWGVLLLFYAIRVLSNPDVSPIVDNYLYRGLEVNLGLHQQRSNPLLINAERIVQGMFYMWRPLLLIVLAVSIPALWKHQKSITLFLLSTIIGMWVPLVVVAGQLSTRYLTLVGHLCVVLIAGGVWALRRELAGYTAVHKRVPHQVIWLPIIAIGIWIAGAGIPFWRTLIDDPTALALPDRDQHEYFRNQTGYAIQDILETVESLPPISSGVDVPVVIGMVRNCHYLPYHLEATRQYSLECPKIGHDSPDRPHIDLNAMLAQYGSIYVMVEEFDHEVSPQQIIYWCLVEGDAHHITTYQRPFDGVRVSLYEVVSMPLLNKVSTCGPEWIDVWMASAYRVASSNNK